MKILILGATGMLGSALVRYFAYQPHIELLATARQDGSRVASALGVPASCISGNTHLSVESLCALSAMTVFSCLHSNDPMSPDSRSLLRVIVDFAPDVVINAVGVIKQSESAKDPLQVVPLNTLLPHFLARITQGLGARLIHISTDCVFSGNKGLYTEADAADATDLYGRSKYMGEVRNQRHVLTLRTSIIGHEPWRKASLLEWFLAQSGSTPGYRRAVFSGLPTVELARVIGQNVLSAPALHGLYHVAAEPIDKHKLLQLIAQQYEKKIAIEPADEPVIDRSLDATRFFKATGYQAPAWPELIRRMHAHG